VFYLFKTKMSTKIMTIIY